MTRIFLAASFLALVLPACSGATAPGTAIDGGGGAGGTGGSGGAGGTANDGGTLGSPCEKLGVPEIACADGVTTPVCTVDATGRASWVITCPSADAGTCDCGAAPALARVCPDGSTSTATCARQGNSCGYIFPCGGGGGTDGGEPTGEVASGVYGGAGAEMTIASNGTATYRFDCAAGQSEAILPNAKGHFSAAGTLARGGGPAQFDAAPSSVVADYAGDVSGKTITFTVTTASPSAQPPAPPYSVTLGQPATLHFCQ